ncbi:MAG: PLDc N-terminal domain-containing protein [Candidatus Omnitrophica bacterium]|nr:PLDc N-terminal domain-containing protein [Candidatus Omnitrophota bacterium]
MEISLLGLLYFVVVIIALVDIFKGSLSALKKVLWGIVVFAVPVVGIILYYLLGRTQNS